MTTNRSRYRCETLVLIAGFAAMPASVANDEFGENDPKPIEQIIVVANKAERSIRSVAANVTILSQDQFELEMANSIADVLRYTPGIDYEAAGTRFGTEGVNIRGIGGNRVALLVDGIPMSDQFDVGSFSNATRDFVNAGFVQHAEVLHGPASALYGSAAIGGVVALRTPVPTELTGTAQQGGSLLSNWNESDGSLHGVGIQAIRNDRLGLLLGVGLRNGEELDSATTDVNLDSRDYERRSAIIKISTKDRAGNEWSAGYYHQLSDVESNLNSILGSGRFRSTTALESDDTYRMDTFSVDYQFAADGGLIDTGVVRAYTSKTDIDQKTLDERGRASRPVSIDRLFQFNQELNGIELNLQREIIGESFSHHIGFGLEFRQRRTEELRDGLETDIVNGAQTRILLGEAFPLRDFPISRSTDWGAYVEDSVEWQNWTIIAGLRADRYTLDAINDSIYREDFPFAEPVSLSEAELSPKLGIVYRAAPTVDIYLQYSHGFRAPPYEDANIGLEIPVFNVRAIPNPDLKSESSDGYDIGLRWQGEANSARLSAFRAEYDDFIETKVRLGTDPVSGRILFQSQNIQTAVIEGLEAGWSISFHRLLHGLSFDGSAYWARGENRDTANVLNSVGPAQATIGLNWTSTDGSWQTRLRGTLTKEWSERDETAGDLFKPPAYEVFDLYVARRVGDRLTVRAGVRNLTNRKYWVWSDVRGLGTNDPSIPFLARPGRSLTLGLGMNW